MTHRRLIPAACALALLLLTTMPAHATTFWNEGFEYPGNAEWHTPGTGWVNDSCTAAEHIGIMEISSERSFRGTKSLKYTYIGLNPIKTCFIDRFFPLVSEIYTRRYLYLSTFHSQFPATKQIFLGEKAYVNFWELIEGTANNVIVNVQGSTLPGSQATTAFGTIPSGRWVCLETHIKYNTPGVANGILEEWMDGVLRFSSSAMFFNSVNQTGRFNFMRLYRQHGSGEFFMDELATGSTRIGCLGAASTDKTPPASPSNFVVN